MWNSRRVAPVSNRNNHWESSCSSPAYDEDGNLVNYTDSVMGNWSFNYDSLNRLSLGTQTPVTGGAQSLCWTYDTLGNRTTQATSNLPFANAAGASSCQLGTGATLTGNFWNAYSTSTNQITSTNARGVTASPNYDPDGNVTSDGANTYLYDAEDRICAVAAPNAFGGTTFTGYIYDAAGTRVSKGTIQTLSCDPVTSGFAATNDYILGPGGEQLTEYAMNVTNGVSAMAWLHTNIFAAGHLIGTYDDTQVHFYMDDQVGTRRVQTDYAGNVEQKCSSLPYGDGETCGSTPTEHLFTGKERDTESGNDYFGARYYASTMGRFMSPDWSAKEEPIPYAKLDDPQTLNLYDYMRNNPLGGVDADGHDWMDGLQYASGVVQGVASSLTGGLVGSPRASDSTASLTGQLAGSLAVTHISATALGASGSAAVGGLVAAPESGGTSIVVEPVAGVTALVSLAAAAGGAKNTVAVAMAAAKKPSSPNQMNQEVRKGQAPKDVTAVHTPHTDDGGNGQNHVHFSDGTSQNQDGSAHHGTPSLTNSVKDWLKGHGW
jgi:RHS repeat-associated protein